MTSIPKSTMKWKYTLKNMKETKFPQKSTLQLPIVTCKNELSHFLARMNDSLDSFLRFLKVSGPWLHYLINLCTKNSSKKLCALTYLYDNGRSSLFTLRHLLPWLLAKIHSWACLSHACPRLPRLMSWVPVFRPALLQACLRKSVKLMTRQGTLLAEVEL